MKSYKNRLSKIEHDLSRSTPGVGMPSDEIGILVRGIALEIFNEAEYGKSENVFRSTTNIPQIVTRGVNNLGKRLQMVEISSWQPKN